jgi:hypothetical protein
LEHLESTMDLVEAVSQYSSATSQVHCYASVQCMVVGQVWPCIVLVHLVLHGARARFFHVDGFTFLVTVLHVLAHQQSLPKCAADNRERARKRPLSPPQSLAEGVFWCLPCAQTLHSVCYGSCAHSCSPRLFPVRQDERMESLGCVDFF